MASKEHLYLRIITPDGVQFSDYVEIITIKTMTEGYEGIMKKHLPLCAEIAISQCVITTTDHEKRLAILLGGFMYNDGDEMKILTPYFAFFSEINRANVVQKINELKQQIAATNDKNRLRTLNVLLRNETNKLQAIDDSYNPIGVATK